MQQPSVFNNLQAVLWVASSVGLFSLVFASGKFIGDEVSALQILFLRYLGGVLVLSGICLLQPADKRAAIFHSKHVPSHILRTICGSMGGVAIIYACTHMPVVDAAAIGLLDTVFLIILGVVLLKERLSRWQALAIVLCFTGAAVLVAAKGAFLSTEQLFLIPILAALLSAVLIAVESIVIKQLTRTESPLTMLVYVNILGALLLAIPSILMWDSMNMVEVVSCLLLGPLAITAQYLTIRGYQLADVVIVGPVNYTWLIFAALLGWYFFDEIPTAATLTGAALIVAGGVMLVLLPSVQSKAQQSSRGKTRLV